MFAGTNVINLHKIDFEHLPTDAFENLVSAENYKSSEHSFEFSGQVVTTKRPKASADARVSVPAKPVKKQNTVSRIESREEQKTVTAQIPVNKETIHELHKPSIRETVIEQTDAPKTEPINTESDNSDINDLLSMFDNL